jgi:hypothetical protein
MRSSCSSKQQQPTAVAAGEKEGEVLTCSVSLQQQYVVLL